MLALPIKMKSSKWWLHVIVSIPDVFLDTITRNLRTFHTIYTKLNTQKASIYPKSIPDYKKKPMPIVYNHLNVH